jgi:hypothetical protein
MHGLLHTILDDFDIDLDAVHSRDRVRVHQLLRIVYHYEKAFHSGHPRRMSSAVSRASDELFRYANKTY